MKIPARMLKCTSCEYKHPTFLTDEELSEVSPPCPICGCPKMEIAK